MYELVPQVLQIVGFGGSSDVPFFVPEKLRPTIEGHSYHVSSYIKFTVIVKQQIFQIELHN